ncbi:MAG: heme-copper oxidase subunit III [Candidatus Rokubacteria bacterium]|nr:heme-copper oxidase subunit III [Candidatus Rokubacteria bacterium]
MSPTLLEAPPAGVRANGRTPPPARPTGGGDDHEGEPGPRRPVMANAQLATMFVIAAETMFFAGLIFSFLILRVGAAVWPPPLQPRLPLGMTAVNTLVLLASSAVMVRAVRSLGAGDRAAVLARLGGAAGLGALFLTVQGFEWARLIRFGLTVSSGAYGATFYTLIGAHAAHVGFALTWLAVAWILAARGRVDARQPAALKACAMYWHFVVALWPVIWVSVYLV